MRYLIAGLVKLMTGILKSPNYTTVWVAWLIALNLLVPLALWSHQEARVIAVVFLAGRLGARLVPLLNAASAGGLRVGLKISRFEG